MHVHMIIRGRVQGVGFRYSAQFRARELDLKGKVRNLLDGTVELEVEGPEHLLEQFITECREGFNPAIRVDDIHLHQSEKERGYSDFVIHY